MAQLVKLLTAQAWGHQILVTHTEAAHSSVSITPALWGKEWR